MSWYKRGMFYPFLRTTYRPQAPTIVQQAAGRGEAHRHVPAGRLAVAPPGEQVAELGVRKLVNQPAAAAAAPAAAGATEATEVQEAMRREKNRKSGHEKQR